MVEIPTGSCILFLISAPTYHKLIKAIADNILLFFVYLKSRIAILGQIHLKSQYLSENVFDKKHIYT